MRLLKKTILKIKHLRKTGRSIPEISRRLSLPKSTVSTHIREVTILPQYYPRWLERRNAAKINSEKGWRTAIKKAKAIFPSLTKRELALIGATLYWGEGTKRDFGLSNTDPQLVSVFVYILKKVWGIQEKDLKISLRIYEDLDRRACLEHWSKIVGFELNDRTSVNVLRGSKQGKLKYGMCRIRVKRGGWLLKEITSINRRVAELISPT